MFKEIFKLMRPQQWTKNSFIVAPLFFTPTAVTVTNIKQVFFGVICFNILASAIYILNDAMDRQADRQHPTKCKRPLAAGTVPLSLALCGMFALTIGGLTLAYRLTPTFFNLSLLYLCINLAYSLGFKKISILDIMLVAFGFVLRVFAGASLIQGHASEWIIVCTGLVALFIALAKRRDDIVKDLDKEHRQALTGYNLPFLDAAIAMMLAGLLISYLIYTVEAGIANLYLTTPFVIMGVLRYLQIALVEHRSGSPTTIVLTDRFLIGNVMAWIISFGILIYGR